MFIQVDPWLSVSLCDLQWTLQSVMRQSQKIRKLAKQDELKWQFVCAKVILWPYGNLCLCDVQSCADEKWVHLTGNWQLKKTARHENSVMRRRMCKLGMNLQQISASDINLQKNLFHGDWQMCLLCVLDSAISKSWNSCKVGVTFDRQKEKQHTFWQGEKLELFRVISKNGL